MKIRTKTASQETQEVKTLVVYIGETRYRISESVDNKLTINKISDGDSDAISIFPRYANEIDVL